MGFRPNVEENGHTNRIETSFGLRFLISKELIKYCRLSGNYMAEDFAKDFYMDESVHEIRKTEHRRILESQRYGIGWKRIPENLSEKVPTLSFDSMAHLDDEPGTNHILLKGENFHALTCLAHTHKSEIDVIYIDPPYNTGADRFGYADKRVLDKYPDGVEVKGDHPLRHSYWMSFMEKRLRLARELLSDDGVIFIHIDDNEVAQLKLTCDGIFGESAFIGQVTWERARKGKHLSVKFTRLHDYILISAKNGRAAENMALVGEITEAEDGPLLKTGNADKELIFPADCFERLPPDGTYSAGELGDVSILEDFTIANGQATGPLRLHGPFIWTQKNLDAELEKGGRALIKTEMFRIRFLKNDRVIKALPSILYKDVGTNEDATTEVRNILGLTLTELRKIIQNPKPVSLLKKLILTRTLWLDRPLKVLDFFAGTGTTGHAVLEINNEYQQEHQFILVTNNENEICDNACRPRLENVMFGCDAVKVPLGGTLSVVDVGESSTDWNNINDDKRLDIARECQFLPAFSRGTFILQHSTDYWAVYSNLSEDKYTCVYFEEDLEEFDVFKDTVESLEGDVCAFIYSQGSTCDYDELLNCQVQSFPSAFINEVEKAMRLNRGES